MSEKVGTMTSNLRVNLRLRSPRLLGLRFYVGGKLLALAAQVFGGRLIVDVEGEIETAPPRSRKARGRREFVLGTVESR